MIYITRSINNIPDLRNRSVLNIDRATGHITPENMPRVRLLVCVESLLFPGPAILRLRGSFHIRGDLTRGVVSVAKSSILSPLKFTESLLKFSSRLSEVG